VIATKKPIVGISIGQQKIVCSSIVQHKPDHRFQLYAFHEAVFNRPIVENAVLLNITAIINIITSFLNNYRLKKSYVIMSIASPGLFERIIGLSVESPHHHHVINDAAHQALVWDYQPMSYHTAQEKTYYYICGIAREQLFCYQLLALKASLNCIAITPHRVALLKASNHLFPGLVQQTPITNHAILQSYIHHCINHVVIDDIFSNPQSDVITLIESLGLYFIGKDIYEYT
jgi:hypothetical protein